MGPPIAIQAFVAVLRKYSDRAKPFQAMNVG